MLKSHHLAITLAAAVGVCTIGCAPKFESKGTLTIDGAPFRPTTCHVLGNPTGIELSDAAGSHLKVFLPPQRLDAFKDITGVPSLTFEASEGKTKFATDACGSLTMTGEGYHGSGKRAASGHAVLSCSGEAVIQGDLTFEGCF